MSLVDDKNVQDINLSGVEKKKFRINGDNTRILELNTSDLGIIPRMNETYPKLLKQAQEALAKIPDGAEDDIEEISKMSEVLRELDKSMRENIDYIFDSNVSEVCAPSGSMYDPVNGKFRFEHIIEALSNLFSESITTEFKKISDNISKHTSKYTKKKKK